MMTLGFHSEWLTIGKHRILISKRAGFPDEHLRFVARLATEICDQWHYPIEHEDPHNPNDYDPYVVAVEHDDTAANTFNVIVAAVEYPQVKGIDQHVRDIFRLIYNTLGEGASSTAAQYDCELRITETGATTSDQYNQMEHLSVQAGIAADRFGSDAPNQPSA